jgi:ATP-dependent Lon protease
MVSALTGIVLKEGLAMTGEITLTGKILPVGGLKEKSLAALRAGLTTILVPEKNRKDLAEIPAKVRRKLEIRPVAHMDEVLAQGLIKMPSKRAPKKTKSKRATRPQPAKKSGKKKSSKG